MITIGFLIYLAITIFVVVYDMNTMKPDEEPVKSYLKNFEVHCGEPKFEEMLYYDNFGKTMRVWVSFLMFMTLLLR